MNINDFEKSMTNLDEALLDRIQEERFCRTERMNAEEKTTGIRRLFQNRTAVRWALGMAAALCLVAVGLVVPHFGIRLHETDTSAHAGTDPSGNMEKEYQSIAFTLIPSVFPDGLKVQMADVSGVLSPDHETIEERLQVILTSQDREERMRIEAASAAALLSDEKKILNAQNLTMEDTEACLTVLPDGQHFAFLILRFNDRLVSYEYTGKKLSAADLYACIVSARYFQ